ncbi:MAG: glycerol-3-phosphate 1-O-acyltransferase PlsY [Planctomycetes bacterium]|nr:glycerol-3-phosphate 1-O-acyltransferase PlsY [Planctomycetota bacterium]
MTNTQWIIYIFAAYVAGSIPFGVLIAKTKGINIREHGSKNIGATNVGRVLGKRLGISCFFLDVLKGVIPILVVGYAASLYGKSLNEIGTTEILLWICVALAALLGHMYSLFLRFGGGKGVATTFGGMIAMWPFLTLPVLVAFASWIITVKTTKLVSLASLVSSFVLFIATAVFVMVQSQIQHAWPLLAVTFLISVMVFWKHRSNIKRIMRGEEPKIGGTTK